MKMEILLEPTSNKLLVGDLCDSTRIKLVSTGKKRCYERPHKGVKASANSDIVYFFTSAQDGDPLQDDITSSGWPFVSAVLSQMAHLIANITLNSARSYVMQSAFLTQGTVSSISIIFNWGGSISREGFLSSVSVDVGDYCTRIVRVGVTVCCLLLSRCHG
ncbi:hypothetical protein Tco_1353926 [Tanacetum coccineum]